MAKKAASRKSKDSKPDSLAEYSVDFGNVSIGDQSASIGFKIPREAIDLCEADEYFAGRRVAGFVTLERISERGQMSLPTIDGEAYPTIRGTFDSKRFAADGKHVSASFRFAIDEIDVSALAKFAKRSGSIGIVTIEDVSEDEGGGDAK